MRIPACLLILLAMAVSCGNGDSTGSTSTTGGGTKTAKQPVKPKIDPAEEARKQAEAEAAKAKAAEAKKARKKEIAALKVQLAALKQAHQEEASKLPDKSKLRRRLSGMTRDSNHARSIYKTRQKRYDELKKVVQGAATAEIKALQDQFKKAEKDYYGILGGVKEERAAQALGIVEETQVQKEIKALRAAKARWFDATRETRRGGAPAATRSKASSAFKRWFGDEPIRKSVVAKALPEGKSPDSYDFSDLDFYLLMEILEDDLDRKNFADEKKTISANDKKLAAMEQKLDDLREAIAEKMMEGGGEMEEFSDLAEHLPDQKRRADGLERQMGQMREVYNEIEATLERHAKAEDELEAQIRKLQK